MDRAIRVIGRRHVPILIALLALAVHSIDLKAQSASLTVSPTSAVAGGAVTATVANGPGNVGDWVGLFAVGASDSGYVDWQYLNGLRTQPSTGLTSATLTFTMPLTPGSYDLRFFSGGVKLATSATITVTLAATITVTPTSSAIGGTVTATVANGPGGVGDWVGLFPASAPDSGYVDWKYLNGLRTPPATGLTAATLTFTMPLTSGTYNLRLFSAGVKLRTSATITVAAASITVTPTSAATGGTVSATVANGPAKTGDWVGLFPVTATDSEYVDWQYLNGLRTPPATGLTSATLTFTMPTTTGSYNLRLFSTGVKVATSATITVTAPTLTVTPTSAVAGATVTATVANGPGKTGDWVGLFPVAAADTAYIDWKYLNGLRTPPATGLTAATLTFTMPLAPGSYNVRLFSSNVKLTTSATITVAAAASITVTPTSVTTGGTVTATVASGPGNTGDWVGLFPATAPDSGYVDWKYLNGLQTPPAVGLTSATLTFTMPLTAGNYNFRLFSSNVKLTTSGDVAVVTNTVVAAYGYDEGSGASAADASVNGNTATVSQTTWSAACGFGNCLAFNGTSSFVDAPDLDALTPGVAATFEAWVVLTATPTELVSVINKWSQSIDDEYLFGISDTRQLFFAWHTTGGDVWGSSSFNLAVGTGIVPLDTLTHIAVKRNGATLTFYVNGTPEAPLAVIDSLPFRNGGNTLRVGGQARGADRFFPGRIDEVRLYARALTQAEIQTDMKTPITPDTTAPTISAISTSAVTTSGATISWTTNELSDSEVEYGLTTAYGSFSALDPTRVTAHTTTISGLTPSTLYHYRVRSRDAAGNLALSPDRTFTTLEGIPPTVSLTAPAAGATVSGTISVTATAADNVGVAGVQFKRNGVNLGAEDTSAPYAVSWNTTTVPNGAVTLTAIARDAAGNQTTSAARVVTVANTVGQVTLAWDANTEPNLAGYRVYVGTTSGVYTSNTDVGNVTSATVTSLSVGTTYFFAVTAYNDIALESGYSNEVSTTP